VEFGSRGRGGLRRPDLVKQSPKYYDARFSVCFGNPKIGEAVRFGNAKII
jgi:hypothetical protein